MRHITDGELHAYLDGALGLLPEGRGDEVRHHLEECSVCRERLRDEEEIRSQAQDLLAGAALEEMPLPSFEELRARAEASERPEVKEKAPARRRGPLHGLPLAWAATVVLALGVGWMGGEVWRTMPRESLGVPEPANPALRPASSLESRGVEELTSETGIRSATEVDQLAEAPPHALREEAAADLEVQAEAIPPVGETAPQAPESVPAGVEGGSRPGEPLEEREETVVQETGFFEARRRDSIAPTPSAALLTPPVSTPGEPMVDEAGVLFRSLTVSEENTMAVPGLDLLAVEWEEWAPGERALYIRQLLPMGDTLELRYLGLFMGSDPDVANTLSRQGRVAEEAPERPLSPKVMEASLPPGWNQVVMRWGRGWLVARAPLSAESLRGILRSLH